LSRRDHDRPGLDGILVLAKPQGPTSHDMVALVRRLSGTKRVGHGGTLDPFAGGVLPIFLGKATRVVEFHLGATKQYRATVCFGASSTTDDLEGELTPVDGPAPTREAVEDALPAFRGQIQQRPPAYSAINVGGRRAYALARAGQAPDLAPRLVTIHHLTLVDWDGHDPRRPVATLDVTCSAGTYVRAIARDLGEAVGSAAYLGALTRIASGAFGLEDALTVDQVRDAAAAGEDALRALLRPIDEGLDALPVVRITAAEREAVGRGQFVRPASGVPASSAQESVVRLVDGSGTLVALGRVRDQRIAPDKVLIDIGAEPRSRREPPDGGGTASEPHALAAATAPGREAHPSASSPATAPAVDPAPETRLVAGLDALKAGDGPLFVVVGVFDGLHRGHAYLIEQLRREAAKRNARPAVITFDAHPEEILLGAAPPILCDPDERLARLAAAGVEVTVVQHFDRALRMTPYQDFVAMITRRTGLAGLLMTPDAAFGHERRGTPDALRALGREQGFEVVVIPPFQIAGREVRSSDVRALIAAGDLVGAGALLGRDYSVVGERSAVEQGSLADRRREIVTFRLPVALPPAGVYRGRVEDAGQVTAVDGQDGATAALAAEILIPEETGWIEVRTETDVPDGSRLRVTFTA
jgi:tRNA pseudouridine55 synthase